MGERWSWNRNIWSSSNHASRKETFYSKCWFGISWSLHLYHYKQSGKRLSKFSSFCLSPTEFWQYPRPVFKRSILIGQSQWRLLIGHFENSKGNDNTDHEVILSGSVTLDCKVSGGVPIPQIKWFKFGEPLRPNLKLGYSHMFSQKYPMLVDRSVARKSPIKKVADNTRSKMADISESAVFDNFQNWSFFDRRIWNR